MSNRKMKTSLISLWIGISSLVVTTLVWTWLDSQRLSQSKYNLVSELIALERFSKNKKAKYRIAVVGTSLTKLGFSSGETLTDLFSEQKKSVEVIKVTIASGSSSEIEAAVLAVLNHDVDLVIVESNPWTLRFSPLQSLNHQRHWISTLTLSLFNIESKRYNQAHFENESIKSTSDATSLEKFIGFETRTVEFSQLFQRHINENGEKKAKLRFFYPNWSNKVAELKGEDWQLQLSKTQHRLSKDMGILFLPNIPSLPAQAYSDHVHANKLGSEYYDEWLLSNVGHLLK